MKYKIIGIISFFFFFKLDAQPQERIPLENSLMKAIDWYIENTTKYLNEIADQNNEITSNGIIEIELICQRDTIKVVRDNENEISQVSYPRTFTFHITMISENLAKNRIPSYYFVRGKFPVIIYSGIENFVKQNDEGLNNYRRIILNKARGFRIIPGIKAYLLEITNSGTDEFKVKEVPNTIHRYHSK